MRKKNSDKQFTFGKEECYVGMQAAPRKSSCKIKSKKNRDVLHYKIKAELGKTTCLHPAPLAALIIGLPSRLRSTGAISSDLT
jgi:hypothetical protein